MSKLEKVFENADFSEETDLKDRLRTRLLGNDTTASPESVFWGKEQQSLGKGVPGQILSFEELEMVSAAGDVTLYKNGSPGDELLQSGTQPESHAGIGSELPFSANDPNH